MKNFIGRIAKRTWKSIKEFFSNLFHNTMDFLRIVVGKLIHRVIFYLILLVVLLFFFRGGVYPGTTFQDVASKALDVFWIFLLVSWNVNWLTFLIMGAPFINMMINCGFGDGVWFAGRYTQYFAEVIEAGRTIILLVGGFYVFCLIFGLFMGIFGGAAGGVSSSIEDIGEAVGTGVFASFNDGEKDRIRAAAKKRADKRAYDRWYAQDQAAKARWDAENDAKRGKDIAAAQDSARADYYDNQARN